MFGILASYLPFDVGEVCGGKNSHFKEGSLTKQINSTCHCNVYHVYWGRLKNMVCIRIWGLLPMDHMRLKSIFQLLWAKSYKY